MQLVILPVSSSKPSPRSCNLYVESKRYGGRWPFCIWSSRHNFDTSLQWWRRVFVPCSCQYPTSTGISLSLVCPVWPRPPGWDCQMCPAVLGRGLWRTKIYSCNRWCFHASGGEACMAWLQRRLRQTGKVNKPRWKKENFNLKIDSDLFWLVPTLNTASRRS
jgi:hypothetical protein